MFKLPRRKFLVGTAAAAGAAVAGAVVMPKSVEALNRRRQIAAGGPVVVRWNAKRRQWPLRPAGAEFGVVFLSTNDPSATAPPPMTHMLTGDVWRCHPDAQEYAAS